MFKSSFKQGNQERETVHDTAQQRCLLDTNDSLLYLCFNVKSPHKKTVCKKIFLKRKKVGRGFEVVNKQNPTHC